MEKSIIGEAPDEATVATFMAFMSAGIHRPLVRSSITTGPNVSRAITGAKESMRKKGNKVGLTCHNGVGCPLKGIQGNNRQRQQTVRNHYRVKGE